MSGTLPDPYASVVSQASLLDVLLTATNMSADLSYRGQEEEDLDRSIDSSVVGCHCEDEILVGEVRCEVSIRKSPQSDESDTNNAEGEALFAVSAVYTVAFGLTGNHDKSTVDEFFRRIGPLTVWPYFRSHVAMLASSASIDVPVLPVKKFVQGVENLLKLEEKKPIF